MNQLSVVQIELLKILESFMHDKPYTFPEEFTDVEQLFLLAREHKIASVVYEQVRGDAIWKQEAYSRLLPIYKRAIFGEIVMQIQRTEGFLNIYEKMGEEGIFPLVVKGIICRNLYTKSDYRTSGDEDILLPKELFTKCDEVLLKNGFSREEFADLEKLPYEIPYINKQNGTYIELHFTMFSEESGAYGHLNDEFEKVHENKIAEEINGKRVWTMSPTEHLFYLTCHAFKHFLHSGVGVRQIADIVMMAEHYGAQINWADIEERLVRLHMKKFWDALVRIGEEYLGFSLEKAAYPKEMYVADADYKPLLNDLLDSGIFGDSTMERKHSSNMTLRAATTGKANTTASIRASLFPEMNYMKGQFDWLNRHPWLLPMAYAMRIARYLKNREKASGDEHNSVQIGMERVELLRKYDIVE